MRDPEFFLVGAAKSGTTALANYLGQHPEIFMPAAKDMHFFGRDLEFRRIFTRTADWFAPTLETYRSYFEDEGSEKTVGEASAFYLYSRTAAQEMWNLCPGAKAVATLRNPVDMVYSLHNHWLWNLNEDIESFEEALAAEDSRRRGQRVPPHAYFVKGLLYREVPLYYDQVKRFFDVFGRSRVKIVLFDDLKRDTSAVYRDVLDFLEVDPTFQADFRVVNRSMRFRSRRFQELLVNPPGIVRTLAGPVLRWWPLRSLVEKVVFWLNRREVSRPPMKPETRSRLQRHFSDDVARLGDLLDRDLTRWCSG